MKMESWERARASEGGWERGEREDSMARKVVSGEESRERERSEGTKGSRRESGKACGGRLRGDLPAKVCPGGGRRKSSTDRRPGRVRILAATSGRCCKKPRDGLK